jgi:hypothetical protein
VETNTIKLYTDGNITCKTHRSFACRKFGLTAQQQVHSLIYESSKSNLMFDYFAFRNVISTWSSGTGAAGILGASSYAGLTSVGLTASNSLLVMLVVPVVMAAT